MAANRAYQRKSRTNNRGSSQDSGSIVSTQNNSYAGGQKNLPVGPAFLKQDTNAFASGRDVSGASEPIQPGSTLYLYNNSSSVAWVSLATAAQSAPSGFTNGIPLKPNDWTILAADENTFIRTSAATVGLYELKDDTNLTNASS